MPVIVTLVITDGVRSRTGSDGSEVVDSAASSRFFNADFKLWTSTPESILFGGSVGRDEGSTDFGGRTTIDKRLQRCCSFSGISLVKFDSLFRARIDLDFVIAGFASVGLAMSVDFGGTGGGASSFSFFEENSDRMTILMLTIDLLLFNDFPLLACCTTGSSMSYSIVSTCVASDEVGTVLYRCREFRCAEGGFEGEYECIEVFENVTVFMFGVEAARCTG